jgi:hypothetical protein
MLNIIIKGIVCIISYKKDYCLKDSPSGNGSIS